MTFAEAFYRLREIGEMRNDAVSLSVEAWRHGDGSTSLTWGIWSSRDGRNYKRPTAEEAIEAYLRGEDEQPQTASPEALASVGAP